MLPVLVEAIRKEAKSAIWTQGVNLARQGAVAVQAQSPNEIELRVRAPGRPVPWTVVLYPGDEAWECDCPGRFDPCEHVVASALALQKAETEQAPLVATANKWARVVYKLSRLDDGLKLQRVIAHADGTETPLEGSLAGVLARPAEKASLQIEQHDLQADRLLERQTRLAMPPERLDALLRILQPSRNVLLDGRAVVVSDEVVYPRAIVEDRGEAVVVTLTRDPRITELISPGVALVDDALCRLGETALSGPALQHLPQTKSYGPEQIGELTSRILPELARRVPVQVRSKRLPPIDRDLEPRVVIELNQLESGLSVLPTLVYGAPPSVRIDAGRMVYLRGAVPLRDEAREQRLVQDLRTELNLVPGRRSTITGPEMVRFADKLRRWRGGVAGDAANLLSPNVRLRPALELESALGSGPNGGGPPDVKMGLSFQLEGAAGSVSADAVIRAWREGLGLVPIEGGGWAPLPKAWLDKHGETVARLLAARAADGHLANHALPELAALCETLEHPPPPGLDKLAPLVQGFETLPEPILPPDLTATLRPYQLQGASWLAFLRAAGLGGILADDMGLGKTLQTITALGPRSLVVCPTSVLPNWQAELRRFRPGLKVSAYHGVDRAFDDTADVTLTTYAILRLDVEALAARKWSAVVLDEAQAIKNPDSQVARAAYRLQGELRLALSGTPVENRLEDLWSLMHFTNPGLLGGRRDFVDQVAQPIAEGRADLAGTLRKRIRPFVLRRLKRDVAKELPPRSEAILRVTLDERERSVYDAIHAATRAEVISLLSDTGGGGGGGGNVMKALEALLRLRQAACHPALIPGQHAHSSSKVESLVEALDNVVADGHKALVFSQWTSLLDLIEPALHEHQLRFERLDGTTPNRGEVVSRFQAAEGAGGADVMLLSLKAGGTGLNLTAADHVFLVDPWWNPAVEAQAADRAHRIGQERPVLIYRMISEGTVEEKILGLQEKKRALFEAALGEASGGAGITRQDLLELFS